ncbi:MAG TPA: hypothetical protein DCM67_08200 [Propionibacteriaceae bacterium]|nr:hypothetical protein [Propionibacteriaceae bacterium]
MAIAKSAALFAAITAIALSGCTQPDPNAAPTYTCTPTTGTPQPCYKAEHDLHAKEDALYAEAEAVYRKYIAEHVRIYRAGGATTASPVILETLTGEALQEVLKSDREIAANHTRAVGGEFKIGYLRRVPREVVGDSVATWESCVDATSVTFKDDKPPRPGSIGLERAYFSQTEEGLKISSFAHSLGVVESCE